MQTPANCDVGEQRHAHASDRPVPQGQFEAISGANATPMRAAASCFDRTKDDSVRSYSMSAAVWSLLGSFRAWARTYPSIIANADPWPASSDAHAAASPSSATLPRLQVGIRIWLTRSK